MILPLNAPDAVVAIRKNPLRSWPGVSDLDGTVNWFRPPDSRAKVLSDGFAAETTLIGSRHSSVNGTPILNVPEGENNLMVNLENGDLENELRRPFTLGANNQMKTSEPTEERLRVSMTASSGAFRGSFVHPATRKNATFRGVVFQKQNMAQGFFLGSTQSGVVSLVPANKKSNRVETPD